MQPRCQPLGKTKSHAATTWTGRSSEESLPGRNSGVKERERRLLKPSLLGFSSAFFLQFRIFWQIAFQPTILSSALTTSRTFIISLMPRLTTAPTLEDTLNIPAQGKAVLSMRSLTVLKLTQSGATLCLFLSFSPESLEHPRSSEAGASSGPW